VTGDADPAATARRIVDASFYLVLGTADRDGRPWASPVYFAHSGYRELFWVSDPEATHSRNIAEREEVGIVVFDSTVPPGTGQGVYMHATARQLEGDERAEGIEIFSARSREHGAGAWTVEDVEAPAALRLYRAVASEHSVLGERSRRVAVTL
jgi:nitroimidazol reductase NimA-like FMN-containing flavoprotein (pyridoxamine 5'-phosphate oxidase superfamily)